MKTICYILSTLSPKAFSEVIDNNCIADVVNHGDRTYSYTKVLTKQLFNRVTVELSVNTDNTIDSQVIDMQVFNTYPHLTKTKGLNDA